ncbi:ADP-ribosylglycohydrolase family protein [Natrinema pallidum]|nr:ADP-ribosylglycohydrolase family protein [Natrinema pallidum]
MSLTDTAAGALLGLACGDSLGRPVEFQSSQQIAQKHGTVTEMLANGTHNQPAGTITDDTEMALCIARSLDEHRAVRPDDVAERFVAWYDSGPFDIGLMTSDALQKIKHDGSWRDAGQQVWESRPEGSNAGNGSVMRCAPYALAFRDDWDTLARVSRLSSSITHADPRCTYGCAVLNLTLAGVLAERETPLEDALAHVEADAPAELLAALRPIPDDTSLDSLRASGYVIHTLQAALYHGLTADTAEDAIVSAVNMGDDTDTVGAVTGAIAGVRFGASELPERWLAELACKNELATLGSTLATTEFAVDDDLIR